MLLCWKLSIIKHKLVLAIKKISRQIVLIIIQSFHKGLFCAELKKKLKELRNQPIFQCMLKTAGQDGWKNNMFFFKHVT